MSWSDSRFQRHLKTRRFGRQSHHLPEVDSTNRWLAGHWSDFTLPGAVLITDHQTSGRGRFKRMWEDVPGKSLLFSVLIVSQGNIRREGFQQMLPAIALARVLKSFVGDDDAIRLKWPNDVLLNDRKLAGILAERFDHGDKTATVIGMGVNVGMVHREFPESIREQATSIFAETGHNIAHEILLAEIMNEWEPLHDALRAGDTESIRDAWMEFGPSLDSPIARREQDTELAGVFCGIGDSGQLLLRDARGKLHELYSGDILA